MNKIEQAVAPLKVDAIAKARQFALETVARVAADLAAHDWRLDLAAPYPRHSNTFDAAAMAAKAKHNFYSSLADTKPGGYRPGGPRPCAISEEKVARYVKQTEDDAAASYEAYVAKLVRKIGEVADAKLHGEAVWNYSLLHIEKPDGAKETWKTHMITNCSVHGKLFNQWPTRKLKHGTRD